jgi:hypothetical protein
MRSAPVAAVARSATSSGLRSTCQRRRLERVGGGGRVRSGQRREHVQPRETKSSGTTPNKQATSSPLTAAVSNKEIGYGGAQPGERRECAGRPDGRCDRSRAAQSARLRPGAGGGHGPVADSENRGDDSRRRRSWPCSERRSASCRRPQCRTGTRETSSSTDEPRRHAVHRRRRGVVPVSRDRRGAALVHHPCGDRSPARPRARTWCRRPRASSSRHRRPGSTSSTPRAPSPPATAMVVTVFYSIITLN